MLQTNRLNLGVVVYLFLSLAVLFLDSRGIIAPIRNLAQNFILPAQSSLSSFGQFLSSPVLLFRSKKDLEQRVRDLEGENAVLASKVGEVASLREENARMLRLLGSGLPTSWEYFSGRVVSKVGESLTVSTQEEGRVGETAISVDDNPEGVRGGVYVGRAIGVDGRKIYVALPQKEGVSIPVIVRDPQSGERHASGLTVGRGGSIILDQVLTNEIVREGDLILTVGDGVQPPDLLVGYVGRVLPLRDGAWQQAEVRAPLDYGRVNLVFFVKKF